MNTSYIWLISLHYPHRQSTLKAHGIHVIKLVKTFHQYVHGALHLPHCLLSLFDKWTRDIWCMRGIFVYLAELLKRPVLGLESNQNHYLLNHEWWDVSLSKFYYYFQITVVIDWGWLGLVCCEYESMTCFITKPRKWPALTKAHQYSYIVLFLLQHISLWLNGIMVLIVYIWSFKCEQQLI